MEKYYLISDASKMVNVEAHVLRFWEEELMLNIPRNDLGHRYYTDEHIAQFQKIKQLKEYGYQLKAIKPLLPKLTEFAPSEIEFLKDFSDDMNQKAISEEDNSERINPPANVIPIHNHEQPSIWTSEEKMAQFQTLMNEVIGQAISANQETLCQTINTELEDKISSHILKEIDYMMKLKEQLEEERFKKLDEQIRTFQNKNEVASTSPPKPSHLFFKKKS